MSDERHDPQDPAERPQRGPTEPEGPPERDGPLAVQRYRKPDGRTLILFARRDDA